MALKLLMKILEKGTQRHVLTGDYIVNNLLIVAQLTNLFYRKVN